MAVEGIAQNLLEMSETLLVANDLDMIWLAKILQFLDFLGSEGIGGGNVGVAFGLESVFGVERECVKFAFRHLRDEAFQVVHANDGATADVVLPSANLEVRPVGDGHARDIDFAFVFQEGVTVELFQALDSVEKSRVGGSFKSNEIVVDGQTIGLVLVFFHAKVVSLDEFDKVLAFDDTARKLHLFATDAVQVVAKQHDDLVDFGIGGIVGKDDIFIPDELPVLGFDLLRSRDDMSVLREGAEAEKAEQDKKFGFHGYTTILCLRSLFDNLSRPFGQLLHISFHNDAVRESNEQLLLGIINRVVI